MPTDLQERVTRPGSHRIPTVGGTNPSGHARPGELRAGGGCLPRSDFPAGWDWRITWTAPDGVTHGCEWQTQAGALAEKVFLITQGATNVTITAPSGGGPPAPKPKPKPKPTPSGSGGASAVNAAKAAAAFALIKARFPGVSLGGICNCRHQRGTGSNPSQWSVHSVCGAVDVWPGGSNTDPGPIIDFARTLPMVWDAWLDQSPGDVHVQVIPNPPDGWVPPCAGGAPLPTGGTAGSGHHRPSGQHGPAVVGNSKFITTGLFQSCADKQKAAGVKVPKSAKPDVISGPLPGIPFIVPAGQSKDLSKALCNIPVFGTVSCGVAGFLAKLPAYLKIAGGGMLLLGGTAVLLVAATGGSATSRKYAAQTLRLPGVRTVAARRSAIGTARTQARTEQARTEARSRVVTTGRHVKVVSRKQGELAQQAEAEQRDFKGTRDRERLAALRQERRRRAS